eukprot:gene27243-2498_t
MRFLRSSIDALMGDSMGLRHTALTPAAMDLADMNPMAGATIQVREVRMLDGSEGNMGGPSSMVQGRGGGRYIHGAGRGVGGGGGSYIHTPGGGGDGSGDRYFHAAGGGVDAGGGRYIHGTDGGVDGGGGRYFPGAMVPGSRPSGQTIMSSLQSAPDPAYTRGASVYTAGGAYSGKARYPAGLTNADAAAGMALPGQAYSNGYQGGYYQAGYVDMHQSQSLQ